MEQFTAAQARELSLTKAKSFEAIIEIIKHQAGFGERYIIDRNVSGETLMELVNLGYIISKLTDPFGVENFKISW